MRKSLKIASAAVALFLVLGAVAFVYASMQKSTALASDQQSNNQYVQTLLDSDNVTIPSNVTWPCHMDRGHGQRMMGNGLEFVQMLSQNSTLSTVQGTLIAVSRDLLVLSTDSGQVRVMILNEWTVGSEVVDRATLFNGTFVSPGQSLTVNVLKSDLFSNTNFSVNVMLGYEVVNATGTHAYAVLPFNIQAAT
jgi:hypothetical protein